MIDTFKEEISEIRKYYDKINFDVDNLKNKEKLYNVYNIPWKENIIAYIKSRIMLCPLSLSGIIITDTALYRHPGILNTECNRLPFSKLCSYIIIQISTFDGIIALNSKEEFKIWGGSVIGKNEAESEIQSFLSDLKNHLINKYEWAMEQRKDAVQKLIATVREQMKCKKISENILYAFDNIIHEKLYSQEIALLKAECLFRTCKEERLSQYISEISETVGEDLANKIKDKIPSFFENMKNDMQECTIEMDDKYLRSVMFNMTEDSVYMYFVPYIRIRQWKYDDYEEKRKAHEQKFGTKAIEELDLFMGCYKDIQMEKIYNKIKEGDDIDAVQMTYTDSIGFTPLHYAMILKQIDIVEGMLDKKSKYFMEKQENNEENIFDYNILAAYLDLPNKRNICYALSTDVKKIKNRILFQKGKIVNIKKNIYCQQYLEKNYDRYVATCEMKDEKPMDYRDIKSILRDYEHDLKRAEYELECLKNDINITLNTELEEAEQQAECIRHSTSTFITFVRNLFSNHDFLHYIISSSKYTVKLYHYKNMIFVLPAELSIDFNDSTESERQYIDDEERAYNKNNKKYGCSWFSEDAHRNVGLLKKEYRMLSKQYHPDMKSEKSSSATFIEITKEYRCIVRQII